MSMWVMLRSAAGQATTGSRSTSASKLFDCRTGWKLPGRGCASLLEGTWPKVRPKKGCRDAGGRGAWGSIELGPQSATRSRRRAAGASKGWPREAEQATRRGRTLFLLDEPHTGLHFGRCPAKRDGWLQSFDRSGQQGVVIIEHKTWIVIPQRRTG